MISEGTCETDDAENSQEEITCFNYINLENGSFKFE